MFEHQIDKPKFLVERSGNKLDETEFFVKKAINYLKGNLLNL